MEVPLLVILLQGRQRCVIVEWMKDCKAINHDRVHMCTQWWILLQGIPELCQASEFGLGTCWRGSLELLCLGVRRRWCQALRRMIWVLERHLLDIVVWIGVSAQNFHCYVVVCLVSQCNYDEVGKQRIENVNCEKATYHWQKNGLSTNLAEKDFHAVIFHLVQKWHICLSRWEEYTGDKIFVIGCFQCGQKVQSASKHNVENFAVVPTYYGGYTVEIPGNATGMDVSRFKHQNCNSRYNKRVLLYCNYYNKWRIL